MQPHCPPRPVSWLALCFPKPCTPSPAPALHGFQYPAPTAGLPQTQASLLSFPRETNLKQEWLGAASSLVPWVCLQSVVAGRGRVHTQMQEVGEHRARGWNPAPLVGLKQVPGEGENLGGGRVMQLIITRLEGSGDGMLPTEAGTERSGRKLGLGGGGLRS